MVRAYDLTHVRMSFNFCKAKVALFWWWVFAQISDIYVCVIYTCNYPKMYNFSKLESVLFCTFFLSIKYRVTFSEKGSYCYFIFEDMQIGVKKNSSCSQSRSVLLRQIQQKYIFKVKNNRRWKVSFLKSY